MDLLAGNTIVNKAGGIIAGRDVSVTAVKGDVLNERTVTAVDSAAYGQRHTDYTDNAARIEAANDLSVQAGRDINNLGSTLQSGRDLSLSAGRDVNIAATQLTNSLVLDRKHTSSDITQLGATVTAGRDLSAQAGRDLNVIASALDAKRDVALSATEDLSISSAADEQHSYSKSKKVTRQEDHVSQVASTITSGSSVALSAGQDLTVTSSRIEAANEAYLVAGGKLALLAAEDSDYSLYDKKKKGHFGAKKTKHDEVTDVTNIGTEIKTGGDLLLVSGDDQTYQAAKLDSGKDLTLNSGGAIAFEGVKDLHQESHTKSNSNLAWNSAKGKGKTDETLKQSELVAQGEVAIHAVDGLNIDVKQVNQQTVSQAIDAMVKADPQLAWLKDAEQRGDVDWRQVKEIHDSFKYSHSGLGQGAMLAIIIVMSALTAGAASGPLGAAAGASAGSGTAMAAAGSSAMVTAGTATGVAAAGWGNAMITAALSSMVGTATASTINNKGDLGKVLADVTSADALKSYATGAAIAGFGAAFTNGWGRELTSDGNYKTISYAERVKAYAANTALKGILSGSDKKSWLMIAGAGALTEVYEYSAGRGPDARPGVDRDSGPQYEPLKDGYVPQINEGGVLREGKNIGLNLVEGCDKFYSVCHGTPVSNILNQVPGFNGFATLHDGWMINLEAYKGGDMSIFENLGSMPPALLVNYGSLYDRYRVEIESEKKREH
ncbi:hypothetical protein HBH25_22535 [Pseudomonas sp. hsmgli-8]|uniref:DUF637 domain-containing protein n=1 Tax=Pseudomonas quercus TaxID=2722792 RepID=A0ABX0YJM0_9PSED|nr:hemagglutinin repeat-containing protein [Pseudomonas sp. LY10J]NJP03605.1 hypothetical protein [Pseudomonas quercus]